MSTCSEKGSARLWVLVGLLVAVSLMAGYRFMRPAAVAPVKAEVKKAPAARAERPRVPVGGSVTSAPARQVAKRVAGPRRFQGTGVVARAGAPLTQDQTRAEKMWSRLDIGDEAGALGEARALLASPEEEVRSSVVEVLGWVGAAALPELTQLMKDPSKNVADDAYSQWKKAVAEVESPSQRAELVAGAMEMSDADASRLDDLIMEFALLPDDVAVRQLTGLIGSEKPPVAAVAREQYEFITGEPFKNQEATEKWIRENVEAPAPEAPAKK